MTRPRTARRPGFTLVEVLTVIALLALLMSIAGGTFFRIRSSSQRSSNDAVLTKVNSFIDRKATALAASAKDDAKNNHEGYRAALSWANGNPDLALAIWTHAKWKNELPMSFNEARTAVNVNGYSLAPKAIFANLPAGAAGGTPEESAVCLCIAVTGSATGGTATDTDGLSIGEVQINGASFKVFKDVWGGPVAFVRAAYNGEVSSKLVFAPTPTNPTEYDPLDPLRKLTAFAAANPSWWYGTNGLNGIRAPVTWVSIPNTYPGSKYFVATGISAGPNGQWGTDVFGLTTGSIDPGGNDNQVSYRLRKPGNRGD